MEVQVTKETRFAVVMYGGVSLAIYMNGVTQEFLSMVRATAVEEGTNDLRFEISPDSTESVYRDIGFLLANPDLLEDAEFIDDYTEWLNTEKKDGSPLTFKLLKDSQSSQPPKFQRLVVDVLSGSSAGGINGIYLAKALAGGQDLGALKRLWCQEGDFLKLLNDEHSILDGTGKTKRNLGLSRQSPPRSLLNSERMCLKLLRAFEQIDDEVTIGDPMVDEVDLFVTITDFWGIPVPIRLHDQLIRERRHRQFLHFRFRVNDELNELGPEHYGLLSFAARGTSSFPVAFDPMRIRDVNTIIETVKTAYKDGSASENLTPDLIKPEHWQQFLKPSTVQSRESGKDLVVPWEDRVFVDGGYLDNKPFGYAISALSQKQSDVLVDRKLVYVEPKPEWDDSDARASKTDVPGTIANAVAAITSLPTYETIREDLQVVLDRNRLIDRVNFIVTQARTDELESLRLSIGHLGQMVQESSRVIEGLAQKYGGASEQRQMGVKWELLTLGEIAQQKGQATYPYYRLRVAALTDQLAKSVTQRAGFDEESAYFLAIRDLVHAWRRRNFSRGEENSGKGLVDELSPTPLTFLRDFDSEYRLRRLRFVLRQADRLLKSDPNVKLEMERTVAICKEVRESAPDDLGPDSGSSKALQTRFPLVEREMFENGRKIPSSVILDRLGSEDLDRTVLAFKRALNSSLVAFRKELRQVLPGAKISAENPWRDSIESLNEIVSEVLRSVDTSALNFLLGIEDGDRSGLDDRGNEGARKRRADDFLKGRPEVAKQLDKIGSTLKAIYNSDPDFSIFSKLRADVFEILDRRSDPKKRRSILHSIHSGESDLFESVRSYLLHFYENFDAYDQIIFPVTYETPIGEGVTIDVARISPLDARSLVDEDAERVRQLEDQDDNKIPLEKKHRARRKVAGTVFHAFGAFFTEEWRENDILWGRLDGAERLIAILLNDGLVSGSKKHKSYDLRKKLRILRAALIAKAQRTILKESELVQACRKREESTGVKFANDAEFIARVDLVDRNLPKSPVLTTAGRSAAILREVLGKEECGKLYLLKEMGFDIVSTVLKPSARYAGLRVARGPANLPSYISLLFLIGIPLFVVAGILVYLSSGPAWLVGALALLSTVLVAAWITVRTVVGNMIYKKVIGRD